MTHSRALPLFTVTTLVLLIAAGAAPVRGQQATASSAVVPTLVNFVGVLTNGNKPLTNITGVTFSLYAEQQGGSPLWLETQNVQPDKNGYYTVQLGSTASQGLPSSLFVSGQARWLEVQAQGQEPQPRIMLLSVPYAFKAGDAQTLGGKPASAFATASGNNSSGQNSVLNNAITGGGTTDYVPLWLSSSKLGNSKIFQSTAGDLGISTTSPAANLDVNGTSDIRNTLTLFPNGSAPTLSVNGTAFAVSSTGAVTFVSGQTFPGTGTVTSVGSGAGLTGGPITKSGTLSIASGGVTNAMLANSSLTVNPGGGMTGGGKISLGGSATLGLENCSANQVLEYISGAWKCTNAGTGTITGVTAGTDLTGGGTSGNVTLNLDTTKVPLLASANTFTNGQTINTTGYTDGLDVNTAAGNGMFIISTSGFGVAAASTNSTGVSGVTTSSSGSYGVYGQNEASGGIAVYGISSAPSGSGIGVEGVTDSGGDGAAGVFGLANSVGYQAAGVVGSGFNAPSGSNESGNSGMLSYGGSGDPENTSFGGAGIISTGGTGGGGIDGGSDGQGGWLTGGNATWGGDGVDAYAGSGFAGYFVGDVSISGSISKGGGSFKIDHPLDPANKYLYHSFVESPDMKNIYDGVATLDANGEAIIQMPEWFGVLNRDFRYQLTCIGEFAPVYIAEKLAENHFKIGGGRAGMEISWQVTGIRQDAWANAHRIPVEQEKEARLRGYYIHPELYGAPPEKQIEWARHPQTMKMMQQMRQSQPQRRQVAKAPAVPVPRTMAATK